MMNCPKCGNEMTWQSEYSSEECGYDDEGILTFFECHKCGTTAEIFVPIVNHYAEEENQDEGH